MSGRCSALRQVLSGLQSQELACLPQTRCLALILDLWSAPVQQQCRTQLSDATSAAGQCARQIATDQSPAAPAGVVEQEAHSSELPGRQLSIGAASQAASQAQMARRARKAAMVQPWTPSKDRPKQSFLPRRMAFLTQARFCAAAARRAI